MRLLGVLCCFPVFYGFPASLSCAISPNVSFFPSTRVWQERFTASAFVVDLKRIRRSSVAE